MQFQKIFTIKLTPVNKQKLNSGRLSIIEKNVKEFVKLRNSLGKKLPLVRVSFVALETNVHESNEFIDKMINRTC